MKFTISRDLLLKPLQQVCGAVERRHTFPILANVLLKVEDGQLQMTGTDLEVELISRLPIAPDANEDGAVTVPAKKFLDICRCLPDQADIRFELQEGRALVRSGRSRFTLVTLPAADFPALDDWQQEQSISVTQAKLRELIDATAFSMANQDVRYYLNGMLFRLEGKELHTVASDGHRLALCHTELTEEAPDERQVILPRKGVLELQRLLDDSDNTVELLLGSNHLRAVIGDYTFTSKLVDGRFPDVNRLIPRNGERLLDAERDTLRQAFVRASIISSEKFRGVRLFMEQNELRITANNPEQEEAEEVVEVSYDGPSMEIGFNVSYLLDVLNTLRSEKVRFTFNDATSSALLSDASEQEKGVYVVMPMRL